MWRPGASQVLALLSQDFPYNLEPLLLGRELRLPKGPLRKVVTIRTAMRQLLEAVQAAHATGEDGHDESLVTLILHGTTALITYGPRKSR